MLNICLIYLKREIFSIRFAVNVLICCLLMIFFVFMDYKSDFSDEMGLYYFLRGVEYSGGCSLLLMIAILPIATIFCEDWESGMIKFTLIRSSKNQYAFSLTLTSAFSSGLCIFLAYILFSLFVLTRHPLVPNINAEQLQSEIYGFPNCELLANGNAVLCYFIYFLTRSSMTAFYAVFAVFQSVIITNRRLSVISPVIMGLVLSFVSRVIKLPSYLDPLVIFENHLKLYRDFDGSQEIMIFSPITALYPIIYCIVLVMIIAFAVTCVFKYKVSNNI